MSHDPAWRCRNRLGMFIVALGAGLLFGSTGCKDDSADPPKKLISDGKGEKGGDGDVKPPEKKVTAEDFAKEFLAAVAKGEADPAALTPTFKKWVGPPVLPAEQEQGFSESGAKTWLDSVGKGGTFQVKSNFDVPEGKAFRGDVSGLKDEKQFGLRVIAAGSNKWTVDWFMPTSATCTKLSEGGSPELGLARSKAAHFMDVLLDGKVDLAERLMATPVKVKMGGPPTATDTAEGRTYDQGWLATMLKGFAGFGSSIALTNPEPAGDEGATFVAEISGSNGMRKLKLTVARTEGDWAVTELSKE